MAGNAVLKTFSVNIDLKRTLPLEPFEVVLGDTGSRIEARVTNDGESVALEGLYVTAAFSGSAGACFLDSGEGSITLSQNKALITLPPFLTGAGQVSCELTIWSSSEETPQSREDYDVLVTSARFGFYCRRPLMDDEAVQGLPETPLLAALLAEASSAETARAQAEAARQTAFAALMAGAVGLGKRGLGAPTGLTEGSLGQLYYDESGEDVYYCISASSPYEWRRLFAADNSADGLTVMRNATYAFAQLPEQAMTLRELAGRLAGWFVEIDGKQDALTFDSAPAQGSSAPVTSGGVYSALHEGDWETAADFTIQSAAQDIEIDSRMDLQGGGSFSFDELRLFIIGSMRNSAAARVLLNGGDEYMRFASFAMVDPVTNSNAAVCLTLKKPSNGFARAVRYMGGDGDDEGYSAAASVQTAMIRLEGLTAYTAIELIAEGRAAFEAGTRFILQGRKTQ